ncbi:MAG: hypothetical protein V8R59_01210 [Enterocloster sp.]
MAWKRKNSPHGSDVHRLAGEKAAGAGSHSLLATELSQAEGMLWTRQ